ncbi:MAG: SpoIIE family protein phosphatase, partial [Anaerolineae bacterium]|nr:SpoIIE family protein phosphatase [Anaerolineae bacterium]
MFVTCFYALLDPASGHLQYANAGHDWPYCRRGNDQGRVEELQARGMPLGLMPDMTYEEKEIDLAPGESILFYSDGLVEAHNPRREMYGFPRLKEQIVDQPGGAVLIDFLLEDLAKFTGPDWEQEDDVTLVTLERTVSTSPAISETEGGGEDQAVRPLSEGWETLAEFSFTSEPGNDRLVAEQVITTVAEYQLPARRLERLKTAVAEATMNAMEHGNQYRPELAVSIQVLVSETAIAVRITDQGGNQPIASREAPDLDAKLAGLQTPRGWGLFLIEKMADEMKLTSDQTHHTIELVFYLEGDENGTQTA